MNQMIDQKPLEDLYDRVSSAEEHRIRVKSIRHIDYVREIIAKGKRGEALTEEEADYAKWEM